MDVLARVRALAAADVLGAVAPPALVVLAEHAAVRTLAAGTSASTVRDGERVALVVARGELDDGAARHGPGAVLGLVGVLATAAPPIEAVAHDEAVVLELGADDVLDVLAEHPPAARALAARLAAALRERA